ncbi:MAG: hypothetical protein ACK443_08555 [Methylococcaceae bacterium]|jgi:hypothetical protein
MTLILPERPKVGRFKDTIRDFKQGSDWLYFDGLSALDVVLTPKRGGVLLTWGSGADSIFFRRASTDDIQSSWSFSILE